MVLFDFLFISIFINFVMWHFEFRRRNKFPVILLFHQIETKWRPGVGWNYVKQFEAFMYYLKKHNYNILPVTVLLEKNHTYSGKDVIITFDDGYEDIYEYVLPIMKRYGFPFAIFPIVDFIGKYNDWDFVVGPKTKHLSEKQLKILAKNKLVTIGSHSLNHLDLKRVSGEIAEREINESKRELEGILGKSVEIFSYPFGKYNEKVRRTVIRSGYKMALSYYKGNKKCDMFAIPRTGVYAIDSIFDFAVKLHRYVPVLSWYEDLKGRTINLLSDLACSNKRKNEIC
ncbi:MAG: polysaccharide deacetylase family protein [Proteobacteria bacterium]|nr:polysaccharide deacetylase family protein [Pseudomonadota bacterium]